MCLCGSTVVCEGRQTLTNCVKGMHACKRTHLGLIKVRVCEGEGGVDGDGTLAVHVREGQPRVDGRDADVGKPGIGVRMCVYGRVKRGGKQKASRDQWRSLIGNKCVYKG